MGHWLRMGGSTLVTILKRTNKIHSKFELQPKVRNRANYRLRTGRGGQLVLLPYIRGKAMKERHAEIDLLEETLQ